MKSVSEFPLIGRKTDFDVNVRLKIVRNYFLFYEFDDKQVKVLSVWDSNRDNFKFRIK